MNFGNAVPLSSFCAFEKQEGKAKESCKNHERLQWELCRGDIWRTKAKVPWLLWRKYENKTRKKMQEAREKNNQYKKVKWDLQGNKNKG